MAELETEKASPVRYNIDMDLDEIGETKGYIFDISFIEDKSLVENLKLAHGGHTILIPRPSDDLNDLLNWSSWKNHTMLVVISLLAWLPDYGRSTGAITLLPQVECVYSSTEFFDL